MQDKKVTAFDNSGTKVVSSASPGPTTNRCEPQLFLAALGQAVHCWKALDLTSLNMQLQQEGPKDKKLQLFKFFGGKLRYTVSAGLAKRLKNYSC